MKSSVSKWSMGVAFGVLLILLWPVPAAVQGDPIATLTVDKPIRVPGATLTTGTYVFERVESRTDRQVVQVFRAKPRRLIVTVTVMPTVRDGGGADMIFEKASTGSAPELHVWFPRGAQEGLVFVYRQPEVERAAIPVATSGR